MSVNIKADIKLLLPPSIEQRWQTFSSREQSGIKFLASFVFVALIYLLILSPLQEAEKHATLKLTKAQNEWLWLQDHMPEIMQATKQNAPLKSRSALLSTLQQTLRKIGLLNQQTLFTSDNLNDKPCLKVSFDLVEAPQLFFWLSTLSQLGINPIKADITAQKIGYVKATLLFEVKA